MRMTGGRAVVEALVRSGVDTVFGIPGVHTLEIYDGFFDHEDSIRHIVTRHEGGAGFMADGYARATGKVGVCLVITGPGVTNTVTALGEAFSDSSPVLMISSQNQTDHMDRDVGALHQLKDQLALTSGCTAWNQRVTDPADIPGAVSAAIGYLQTHRPRPVHIEIPTDVLEAEAEMNFQDCRTPGTFRASSPQVDQAVEILLGAERPLLWIGGGAVGASEALTELAEMLGAAVVCTGAGKGIVRDDHPLSLGSNLRSDEVREFVGTTDAALVIGSELGVVDTGGGQVPLPDATVRVDVDAPGGDRLYRPRLEIRSDARLFAEELLRRLGPVVVERDADAAFRAEVQEVRDTVADNASDAGEVRAIVDVLRQSLLPEDVVVCDMTMLCYRATSLYPALQPGTFLFPRGFGTLGWSMPAAIGAKLGDPDRNVVSLCGDGGFLFTVQELATAVKYELPLPILLMNNESYGVVERNQERRYGRALGTDICNPDFMLMAESFGAIGRRLTDAAELPAALSETFSANRPTIIEFRVDF